MLRKGGKLWPLVAEGWVAEQEDEELLPSAAEGWVAEQNTPRQQSEISLFKKPVHL